MFWGVTLDGGKKYQQTVEKTFHLSMAVLKPSTASNSTDDAGKIQSVCVKYNNQEFIVCVLNPSGGVYQSNLDLVFEQGNQIEFYVVGGLKASRVYLTGYVLGESQINSNSLLTSTPGGVTLAIASPTKGQPSILVDSVKKSNKSLKDTTRNKRVSIQDAHEEVKYKKAADADEDFDSDEEDEQMYYNMFGSSDDDEEDENYLFELDDDDDEDEEELDEENDVVNLEDEEPSFLEPIAINLSNGKANTSKLSMKDKKKLGKSDKGLTPASAEDSMVVHIGTPTNKVQKKEKLSKPASSLPNKKQKLDTLSPEASKTPEQLKTLKTPSSVGHTPKRTLAKGGVMITEVKIGTGIPAKVGKMVEVKYVGRLKRSHKLFDSGNIKFRLGKNEVIKGWDIGVEGMKVGGKRTLVIPPNLAYGSKGSPPDIPPNSTLSFEVELLHG